MQINLKNVTLACGDNKNKDLINHIIKSLTKFFEFGDIIFNNKIKNLQSYNLWVTKKLKDDIKTDFCLIIQWDGFPINPSKWNEKWLDFDYIGAPWINHPYPDTNKIGNGGFSLRSKKYLDYTSKINYSGIVPEDVFFCSTNRISECKYATYDYAKNFSIEDGKYTNQFGFHGIKTIIMNKKIANIYKNCNNIHPLIKLSQESKTDISFEESYNLELAYKNGIVSNI